MRSLKLFLLADLVIVLVLAIPVMNLLIKPTPSHSLSEGASGRFADAARILEEKCAMCHAGEGELPFYAELPIAKGLIQSDIERGIEHLNMAETLTGDSFPPSALAKIEYTLNQNRMPPGRYHLLHWDGMLSEQEKQILLKWIAEVRRKQLRVEGAADEFVNEPVQPLPLDHGQDPRIAELGDRMFHDVRLSVDNTLSCASCHALDKGGTDQARFSTGVQKQINNINSPTIFNTDLQFAQFWDGRAPTLEAQADGPVNNPIEMGSNWEIAMEKLRAATDVVEAFEALFPDGLTPANVMTCIAAFERTLLTPSRFDQYLRGDHSALTEEEKEGYEIFKSHACATCHSGPALGGVSYEKMGLKRDYFKERGNEILGRDMGRYNVTQNEKDRHRFKTPTLRNIERTFPYFHDGSTSDLKEAVKIMADLQSPRALSDAEADRLTLFLKSLTGEYNGQAL